MEIGTDRCSAIRSRAGRLLPAMIAFVLACHRGADTPGPAPVADGAIFTLGVAATPDSAVKLARFALAIVDGVDDLPRARKEGVVVARRYARARKGGGQTDVAVFAIVLQPIPESTDTTLIQLSAWVLETRAELPQPLPQRRAHPAAAVGAERPVAAMRPNQPRRITASDSTDWGLLQLVLAEFARKGVRPLP
jgi:hypothetical protein